MSEIESTSQENLSRMITEDDYNPFVAASSEQKLMEPQSLPRVEDSVVPEKFSDQGVTTAAVDDYNVTMEVEDNVMTGIDIDVATAIDQEKLVHASLEIKSDPELFQEIIKSPDQNDIDELLNEEMPHSPQNMQQNDDGMLMEEANIFTSNHFFSLASLL